MTTERVTSAAYGHGNAEMSSRVVRGFVREDADWAPAIEHVLRVAYSDQPPQELAAAVDLAMMKAIHAAARTGAVRELGVQITDSTNPVKRLVWRVWGSREARARADVLNSETAMLAGKE